MPYNRTLGTIGENIAKQFLLDHGFEIVERNWAFKRGEIDLIVKNGDEWRFVEVKTRSSIKYGYPEEAVDDSKAEHIYLAIDAFIRERSLNIQDINVDIIAIILSDRDFDVTWLKNSV